MLTKGKKLNSYSNRNGDIELDGCVKMMRGFLVAGRDWGQEEKGTTEDEMAGWHH